MNIAEKLGLIEELKSRADKLFPLKDWDMLFLEK